MKISLILGTMALSLFCPSLSWGQINAPAKTTPEAPQLGARILLNARQSYSKGEEVVLEITMENTGRTPLRLHNWDIEFLYEIEVTAGQKKVEPLPDYKQRYINGAFFREFVLYPRAKRKGYFYLSRAFDLSKEGLYTVTVSQKSRQAQSDGIFTITSQPLDFKIVGLPTFGYWEEDTAPSVSQPKIPPAKQP